MHAALNTFLEPAQFLQRNCVEDTEQALCPSQVRRDRIRPFIERTKDVLLAVIRIV